MPGRTMLTYETQSDPRSFVPGINALFAVVAEYCECEMKLNEC